MEKRKDLKAFKEALGKRESKGNYKAKNKLGYIGKYQFGLGALIDTGYKTRRGKWLGLHNINSEKDFLNNPEVQEKAMDLYLKKQRTYLRRYKVLDKIGQKFKGILLTESGLLAAAHLIGAKGISKMLESGVVKKDGFGTPATEYLNIFGGYDL